MKKIIYIVIGLVAVAAVFSLASRSGTETIDLKNLNGAESAQAPSTTGSLKDGRYINMFYKFTLELPEGFAAREISAQDSSRSILFENNKGDGVQILISPYDDIKVLTADMIKKDIPDMKISDVQVVEVGENYKGVAFLGDNSEFGGASRDVWFVYKGNLYQISTYARLDTTLKSIFATWKFF